MMHENVTYNELIWEITQKIIKACKMVKISQALKIMYLAKNYESSFHLILLKITIADQ